MTTAFHALKGAIGHYLDHQEVYDERERIRREAHKAHDDTTDEIFREYWKRRQPVDTWKCHAEDAAFRVLTDALAKMPKLPEGEV